MIEINLKNSGREDRENIMLCLRTLYGTTAGEQILDRDFGISMNALDRTMPAAKAMVQAEIIRKTRKYEPRVTVTNVSCTVSVSGEMRIEVTAV